MKLSSQKSIVKDLRVSSKVSRRIINEYHVLNKLLLRAMPEEKVEIQKRIDELGGLEKYQQASLLGQSTHRGGDTSKWLMKRIPVGIKLRILDVGALRNNYKQYDNVERIKCVDLNPQTEEIEQFDFMELPVDEQFDVVCLSLVVNFVPSPALRGRMLQRVRLFLPKGGLFYLVLPLACVENSRYMTNEHMIEIVSSLGYSLEDTHRSKKLVYYLFKLSTEPQNRKFGKTELRGGKSRNNFAVILE